MKKRLISTIVSAALAVGSIATGHAAAEAADGGSIDDCATGTPCTFRIGGLELQSHSDAVVTDEAEGTRRLSGTVDVVTPAGPISLVGADLLVRRDESGRQHLERGVTRLPFPSQWFGDIPAESVPFAEFGHQRGTELHHLGAHVRDDREYFYFHFQTDLELALPWPEQSWAELMPQTISFDAGYSATMVLDPTDPYLYLGAPCFSFPSDNDEGDGRVDQRATSTDADGSNSKPAETDGEVDRTSKDDDQDQGEQSADEDPVVAEEQSEPTSTAVSVGIEDDEVGRDLDGEDNGEDCGIGFSWQGVIPSPSLDRPMAGHVVVDFPMPMGPFVSIDGSVVVAIADGARMTGFGDVTAEIPMLSDVVDVAMPLGDAIVETEFSTNRMGYSLDGLLESDGTYEIGFNGLPIALPGNGSVRVASSFGFTSAADGSWAVEPDSFFQADGNLGIGPRAFGELAGLDLEDVATAGAHLRVDRTGIAVSGEMQGQLHSSLQTDAGSALDAFIGFEQPELSFLAVRGSMRVAGTTLGNAALDIDRAGARVAGMMDAGVADVQMAGTISSEGVDLQGRVGVDLPIGEVGKLASDVIDTADAAQAEVARIRANQDHVRDQIIADRLATSENFRLAQVGVSNAEREVASIQGTINRNNSKISYLKRRIKGEKRWYRRLPWYRKGWYVGRHVARLGSWYGGIGALHAANGALYAGRAVAYAALDVARTVLAQTDAALRAIPVDSDPRMIGLHVAMEAAEIASTAAKAVAEPFRNLVGDVRANAEFRLGTSGVFGELRAEWCGDRCVTLAAATLNQDDHGWTGCVVIDPNAPELCARI